MPRAWLSRCLVVVAALVIVGMTASGARAQTQQLNKTLERKFPSEYCPLPTPAIGNFVTDTGSIRLTFSANNGYDDGFGFQFFEQKLDEVTIIEAAEFAAHASEDNNERFCYTTGIVPEIDPGYDRTNNPAVPFFEPFSPPSSTCPWDVSHGAAINPAGFLELGSAGLGETTVSTSVVISGLTPGVVYTIYGEWSASNFIDFSNCDPGSICMTIIVDDLPNGCSVKTQESTWGAVKALYKN